MMEIIEEKKPTYDSTNWDKIREMIEGQSVELGPYFGHQIRHSPRHLLFTLSRYKFAAKMLPQDRKISVLEVGCSEGLGTVLLAENGHRLLGVDADKTAISQANKNFSRQNILFESSNFIGRKLGIFDAIVSLDVIEHIEKSDEDLFMESIKSNLTKDGMCIIGTPNDTATQYASEASQIGHVNMFTAEKLTALLRKNFIHVFIFGLNDEVVHTGFYPMCHYLVALACMPK